MITEKSKPLDIAIIGGGVAGIVTAFLLQRRHNVTLFEQNNYLGGHTNTVVIDSGPDAGLAVDTGFIVLNNKTYPTFTRFLNRLNVQVRFSNMSFGFYCEKSGLQYAGTNLNGLFAQRRNAIRPEFLRMLLEIRRFNRDARQQLALGGLNGASLGEYLYAGQYAQELIDDYIAPMGSAIWSTPVTKMMEFPSYTFIRFFHNHGLLAIRDRPKWQTVVGGSHAYVRAFLNKFKGTVCLNSAIRAIERKNGAVTVNFEEGHRVFDGVVMATHADQTLRLLADPSKDEVHLLSPWQYNQNHTVLHTDDRVMPPNRRAWASWNYRREVAGDQEAPLSMSYHMNRLQGLKTPRQYFVTLNRQHAYRDESIIREFVYTHPIYTHKSIATQKLLPKLNGQRNTYFCGSYFGYGFHEDAVKSAVQIANRFGIDL